MRIPVIICVVSCLVACGDNASPCDYVEANDVGNVSSGEPTQLSIGATTENLCGAIDNGHFDSASKTIDVDAFRVSVEGTGEMLVQIAGDDGFNLFDDVTVRMFDTAVNPTLVAGGDYRPATVDHGAFIAEVPPGSYDVVVAAKAAGDLSIPLGYRVRVSPDPSARCPASTSDPSYREADDGASSTGNDVADVDLMADPSFTLTTAADDKPEPTGITIGAGNAYRLTGSSAATGHTGSYLDRDTFEIHTDATTNELTIRIDWQGATDFDYYLLDPQTLAVIAASNLTSTTAPELSAFPVKPDTTYWLWIGRFADTVSTSTAFDATICGSHMFH